MASKKTHIKWGCRFGIPRETVDYVFSLIDLPNKQKEYLLYSAKVTEWWDDGSKMYAPSHIVKNCKTPDDRKNSEQIYTQWLMESPDIFIPMFFQGRKTGRDQGRVKYIGDFQSYLQRKYIRPKGRKFLSAWYLHHLIDYCKEVKDFFQLTEIINRNRDRVAADDPEYDEVADFIRRNWAQIEINLSEIFSSRRHGNQ